MDFRRKLDSCSAVVGFASLNFWQRKIDSVFRGKKKLAFLAVLLSCFCQLSRIPIRSWLGGHLCFFSGPQMQSRVLVISGSAWDLMLQKRAKQLFMQVWNHGLKKPTSTNKTPLQTQKLNPCKTLLLRCHSVINYHLYVLLTAMVTLEKGELDIKMCQTGSL